MAACFVSVCAYAPFIEVVPLDEDIPEPVTFLKMNIKGAEWDTLPGCEKIISRDHPKLAVCIYHGYDDLWRIPPLFHSIVPLPKTPRPAKRILCKTEKLSKPAAFCLHTSLESGMIAYGQTKKRSRRAGRQREENAMTLSHFRNGVRGCMRFLSHSGRRVFRDNHLV